MCDMKSLLYAVFHHHFALKQQHQYGCLHLSRNLSCLSFIVIPRLFVQTLYCIYLIHFGHVIFEQAPLPHPWGGSFVAKKITLKGVNSVVLRVILSNFLLLFSVTGQYMQDQLLNYCAYSPF